MLLGDPAFPSAWGPLVSVDARVLTSVPRGDRSAVEPCLEAIDRRFAERREARGSASTGIALILSYDLGVEAPASAPGPGVPDVIAIEIDRAVAWSNGDARLHANHDLDRTEHSDLLSRFERPAPAIDRGSPRPAVAVSSLPRDRYLAAVSHVREHILAGDIYQANLTQTFAMEHDTDRLSAFARLAHATAAPRSAFVEVGSVALASVSPEVFLDIDRDGQVSTLPIKGTRPRHADPVKDRASAAELAGSEKDHAELLMIVDLERNDLGRVCRTGSVHVPELARLHSYPAVHHLVARVRGTLREGTTLSELLRATFPGGSISGAPKTRAMEILRELEPSRRGWYTGSLMWLGDDGTIRSSILIRSVVFDEHRAWLGAGGGVVADSRPEPEWEEANAKARALAETLGFVPEEAV